MKDFNFTFNQYIKALQIDLIEIFAKYQQESKDGHFNASYKINLRYQRYDYKTGDMVDLKNRALNGYLKYNNHIRYNKDDTIFISDELYLALIEIMKKYNIENIGTTGLACILSKSILQEILEKDDYIKEHLMKGFENNYLIKKEIYKINYFNYLEKTLTSKQESTKTNIKKI